MEEVERLQMSLQMSERERSSTRETLLKVFEGAKKLAKEMDVAAAEGKSALEHQKKDAFVVQQVLGRLQVCVGGCGCRGFRSRLACRSRIIRLAA